jgi:hypothetical protein
LWPDPSHDAFVLVRLLALGTIVVSIPLAASLITSGF